MGYMYNQDYTSSHTEREGTYIMLNAQLNFGRRFPWGKWNSVHQDYINYYFLVSICMWRDQPNTLWCACGISRQSPSFRWNENQSSQVDVFSPSGACTKTFLMRDDPLLICLRRYSCCSTRRPMLYV